MIVKIISKVRRTYPKIKTNRSTHFLIGSTNIEVVRKVIPPTTKKTRKVKKTIKCVFDIREIHFNLLFNFKYLLGKIEMNSFVIVRSLLKKYKKNISTRSSLFV